MKLITLITLLALVVAVTARTDEKRRAQSMYRMTDPPRLGGVKGGPTTHRPLRKGEYVCGTRICKLRPGEIPKGCEGGECQYNIGHHFRRK
ncbi:uncharacterized protein LOC128680021 [Plodia interpunctella]|uniref:uncharacterized protein LOC128680021 n=1 Tax=Plodia interpunctella TaxID=58824 RepID=UPI002368090B|nr:uncharacterized protein LOC128680021 [Plodia interpunctella]